MISIPILFCLLSDCRWFKENGKLDVIHRYKSDNKLDENCFVYYVMYFDCLACILQLLAM